MICKKFLALLLWCHCYHIVLDPFLHILSLTSSSSSSISSSSYNSLVDTQYDSRVWISSSGLVAGALSGDIKVEHKQIALTPGHEIVLRCDIAEFPEANFTWSRIRQYPTKGRSPPPQPASESLKQTDQIIINNNILALKTPSYTDVGDYKCKVDDNVDVEKNEETISVRARPYILDFNLESSTLKSAVVQEGASLKIPCNVSDEYEPESSLNVKWYTSKYEEDDMNEVIPDEQDGIRIESLSSTSKTLVIDRITKDHRRYYKCQVTNGVTDNSKTILIRVKDKYTAIWPAVGIVIEIVILIGVIFIVENRKVEPDKEVYDRKAIQM